MTLARSAALAMMGSAAVAASMRPAAAQSSTIRIGAGTDDAYGEPYYARELGLFKKAGLDVEIMPFANGAAIAEAMAGGAIDVGLTDPLQLGLSAVHDIGFAYFAGGTVFSKSNPTLVLCSNANGPLKTAKDLEGKTIAVISVNSFMGITVKEWLKLNGADPATVKFYELHFAEMPAALARGTVDAALIGEPFLTGAGEDVRRLGIPFETLGKPFYIFGWFAKRDWLKTHTDQARKLAGVLYDVARWANAHHGQSAVIEATFTKLELSRIQAMARNSYATSLDGGLVTPVLDIAYRYKLLPRQVTAAEVLFPLAPLG